MGVCRDNDINRNKHSHAQSHNTHTHTHTHIHNTHNTQSHVRGNMTTAKEQRTTMIETELKVLLDRARDFCFEHLEDDMDPEAIDALTTAANKLAYKYQYYDVLKDKMVYYPSCRRLVLTTDLFVEATKHYYDEDDEFPPEYSKAVRTVVFDDMKKKDETHSKENKDGGGDDNDDVDQQLDNDRYEMMEKLGTEWTDALLES